jgi:basic amino acid/polyamine antiporter, APA family
MTNALDRRISLIALTLYGVGDILGAGIYGLVGKAAGQMGNGLWLAFVASFFVAMLTGLSYAALSSRYQRAAGSSFVVLKAFRSGFIAFVVGLAALFAGLTSMAAASRIFGGYLHGLIPQVPPAAGAVLFLSLLGLILWKGIRESIFVNSVLTVTEALGLLLVIGLGASFLGSVDYFDFSTPQNPNFELPLLLSTSVLVFYSFVGFEDVINMGEEVKDAERTVPRALVLALLVASTIYLGVALVAVSVVPAGELALSTQPLVEVVRRAAPWFPSQAFSMVSLLAVSNTALLNFLMGSRLIYGLAKLNILPATLGHVNPKTKTPSRAIGIVFLLAVGLALSGEVGTLARATSLLLLLVFVAMNLSLLKIKFSKVGPRPHFDVPAFVPALGVVGCVLLLFSGKASEWTLAGIMIVIILALYAIMRPKQAAIEKMVD